MLTGSGTTASQLTTVGNYGLYDASTFANLQTPANTYKGNFIIAASSLTPANDKIGPFHGGYAESTKSKTINPKYISAFVRVAPKTATNSVVAVGLTAGLNNVPYAACSNKTYKCDETYYLRVDIKGSPAMRFLNRNAYYVADYYTGCCATGQTSVDPGAVMVGWAKSLAEDPHIGLFINPVVYASTNTGASYTAYVNPTSANIGKVIEVKITNGGSGYSSAPTVAIAAPASGVQATATATITGGVVTGVTITVSGSGYVLSDAAGITFSGGAGSGAAAYAVKAISWNSFVEDTTPDASNKAGLVINGAYVDTKFGDCSFQPTDHFDKEPIKLIASEVDQAGDVCAFSGTCVTELQVAKQGEGFGETVLRDLILSERYAQNHFNDDPRIREILNGNSVFTINRNSTYYRYLVVHNVPRFNNPSSMFDNDQYVCEIITSSISATFQSDLNAILAAAGDVKLRDEAGVII